MPSISVEELERAGWVRDQGYPGDLYYDHPSVQGVAIDAKCGQLWSPEVPSRFVSSFAELVSLYPEFPRKIGIDEVHKYLGRECTDGTEEYLLNGFVGTRFLCTNGYPYSSCEVLR